MWSPQAISSAYSPVTTGGFDSPRRRQPHFGAATGRINTGALQPRSACRPIFGVQVVPVKGFDSLLGHRAWVFACLQYPPGMTTTGYILSWLLAAGVPGFFVYQMWTLRCPKCGHWSLSFPRSGFKRTGPHYGQVRTINSVCRRGWLPHTRVQEVPISKKRSAQRRTPPRGGGGDF